MNVKSKYHLRKNLMRFLLRGFSLKVLVVVYLGLLCWQYTSYGILRGDEFWVPKSGMKMHISFLWKNVFSPNLWLLGLAMLADYFTWPVLFRSEIK
jgi:hypothetical protein